MYEFDTPLPIRLVTRIAAGDVTVTATDTTRTTVTVTPADPSNAKAVEQAARIVVEQTGDRISVIDPETSSWFRWPARLRVTVSLPAESSVEVGRTGADVRCVGPIHDLRVQTDAGDLSAELITGTVDVDSAGGSVRLNRVLGRGWCKVPTGDVQIGEAGDELTVTCDSGDVRIGAANGPSVIRCASGNVDVGSLRADTRITAESGDVTIQRAYAGNAWVHADSGDITVGIPTGVVAYLDIKSDNQPLECDLNVTDEPTDGQPVLSLRLHADCGQVHLRRAGDAPLRTQLEKTAS